MAARILTRIAAAAATLLSAAACIFPYEVDIQSGGERPLVVEGDILIGGTTTVYLSHVIPFDNFGNSGTGVFARGYIEGEDGTRVEDRLSALYPGGDFSSSYLTGNSIGSSTLVFDTSNLSAGQRYRLHFDTRSPESGVLLNSYESDWLDVCPAPTIDGLTYSHHPEYDELWVGLSMHCHGSHYFRWSFSENWEYHSDIQSYVEYIPRRWDETVMGMVGGEYRRPDPTLYYCWSNNRPGQINLFSTAYQIEDRFEELKFHAIPLNDKRLQVMYRITVELQAMSENAYNYWKNIEQNTSGQGSIFSPTPSEMASNVHCTSDPSVQVMGYLNAAVPTSAVMYYDNELEHYYEPGLPFQRADTTISATNFQTADNLLKQGYLPYQEIYNDFSGSPSDYTWAMSICIDCRKQGGTKDRPADWPNNHR